MNNQSRLLRKHHCRKKSQRVAVSFLLLLIAFSVYYYTVSLTIHGHHKNNVVEGRTPHSSYNDITCSCWNATAPRHCCERTIFRAHKFGTLLLNSLFGRRSMSSVVRYKNNNSTTNNKKKLSPPLLVSLRQVSWYANPSHRRLPTTNKRDYRHVLVTRNWFDAIVSGYLYHRAGHECWLDNYGRPKTRNRTNTDWHAKLTFHNNEFFNNNKSEDYPPPRNNRSLCSYLQQESEQHGMRILMDVALSEWYKGVVPYWKLVQQQQQQGGRRSLFVCFEDLVDPLQQEQMYNRILHWLFPGQDDDENNHYYFPSYQNVMSILSDGGSNNTNARKSFTARYFGGHATLRDEQVRSRLRALVEQLDTRFFDKTVATSNAIFGCGNNTINS